jgi:hypothetical protein
MGLQFKSKSVAGVVVLLLHLLRGISRMLRGEHAYVYKSSCRI